MGCGGSKDGVSTGSPDGTGQVYNRRQKISVRHGPQAKNLNTKPNIIFIFGGPGSRKGRVVDDLMTCYGFSFICGEEVIRAELIRRVKAAMQLETIRDVRNMLDQDPEHLTVDGALVAIERRIETEMREEGREIFVVDFLPNLRYLLKTNKLSVDCSSAMQKFESKFPVSFALNLAIPPDKVIKPPAAVPCTKPADKKDGEGKDKDKPKGDEADSSRTKKRLEAYTQNVQNFLDYFQNSERLVTIDVACGEPDVIWNSVHNLMTDMEYHSARTINTVFVFAFSAADVEAVDLEKYDMRLTVLREIVDDPQDSVETVTEGLSKHINNKSKDTEAFIIDVTGTSLEPAEIAKREKKPITFALMSEGYLENFLPGSPKDYNPPSSGKRFKAVSSVENEVFLFPLNIDDITCQRISAHIAAHRLIK